MWPFSRKALSLDQIIERLHAAQSSVSGETVTPDNCMRSPTMQAIVTAVSRRIAVSTVKVMQTSEVNGRMNKEFLPNHPVQRLLGRPNEFQSEEEYWLDATSSLVRWGNFVALKLRGQTGPIRRLRPVETRSVDIDENALLDNELRYRMTLRDGTVVNVPWEEVHHVRTAARNYYWGDSPVNDIRDSIALEIAAEQFGGSFFGNGAVPLMVFKAMAKFRDEDAQKQFIESIQEVYSGRKRHKALLLPQGIDMEDPVAVDNERSQFIETRQYQRTVIAGAFSVPPHLVGDLSSGTFNNVEQQDKDFVINVVLPFARVFESAMERDLLTDQDRRNGIVIRFNLDEVKRADFRTRQEGLWRQRQAGVVNANDWREQENMNPIAEEDGGEDYWQPSNMMDAGDDPEPIETIEGDENVTDINSANRNQG